MADVLWTVADGSGLEDRISGSAPFSFSLDTNAVFGALRMAEPGELKTGTLSHRSCEMLACPCN